MAESLKPEGANEQTGRGSKDKEEGNWQTFRFPLRKRRLWKKEEKVESQSGRGEV